MFLKYILIFPIDYVAGKDIITVYVLEVTRIIIRGCMKINKNDFLPARSHTRVTTGEVIEC